MQPGTAVEIFSGVFGHASGALWIPAFGAALVADAHLGYGWAQRRRGELGAVEDGGAAAKLAELCGELAPRELVLLGDVVHAPRPAAPERALIEGVVTGLAARTAVRVVLGNHDRGFPRDFGHLRVAIARSWCGGGVFAIHGDRPEAAPEGYVLALGHIHPVLRIRDAAGAWAKIRAFVAGERGVILPAFSPFAGGADARTEIPAAVQELLGGGPRRFVLATGRRAIAGWPQ
jgi:metallophosphoesterase superfamily enzyme